MLTGPAPKLISATERNGTEPPLEVGTGRFSRIGNVSPLLLGQRDLDRHLSVGEREFGAVLLDVAQCRDPDGLAQRGGGHAEVGGEVEARLDHDFRGRKIARGSRRSKLGKCLHLGRDPVRSRFKFHRVVTAEIKHDVARGAAGPTAVLALEIHAGIGDFGKCRREPPFELECL